MKKLLVFILLICCVGATALFKFETNPLFDFDGVEKVCFVKNSHIQHEQVDSVECGDLVFNFCSLQTAKQNLKQFKKDTKAVQFYFAEIETDKLIEKLKATIVSEGQFENVNVVMAYTPLFQDCVFVDGKKVNLQIACSENSVIAGFPAILTGF